MQPELQLIKMNSEQEWEVKEIYNLKRIRGGWVKYFIKQIRYNVLIWEKLADLTNCADRLETFYRLYPYKLNVLMSHGARPIEGGGG